MRDIRKYEDITFKRAPRPPLSSPHCTKGLVQLASYEIGRSCCKIETSSSQYMVYVTDRVQYSNYSGEINAVRRAEKQHKDEVRNEWECITKWIQYVRDNKVTNSLHPSLRVWVTNVDLQGVTAESLLSGKFPWGVYRGTLPRTVFALKNAIAALARAKEELYLTTAEVMWSVHTCKERVKAIKMLILEARSSGDDLEAFELEFCANNLPYWSTLLRSFTDLLNDKKPSVPTPFRGDSDAREDAAE